MMATIKPFRAWRPKERIACRVAALPYDVYSREEAREEALKDRLSFLNIDRPETQFPPEYDMYAGEVYEKADSMLKKAMSEGIFIQDERPCYYLYELTMQGKSQTGLVACVPLDDYLSGVVRKHENTRKEKETDRIRHVDRCSAQTGPVFLASHASAAVEALTGQLKTGRPACDFVSDDGIRHRCWVIDDREAVEALTHMFENISCLYIADGHHRAASAVRTGLLRREKYPDYDGTEEFNSFLAVIFPDNQLNILPYNRVVRDLNGYTEEAFLAAVSRYFEISASDRAVEPSEPYHFGCYLDGRWYLLRLREGLVPKDPVGRLDVSVLQHFLLDPVLGIKDPKTDSRIGFVGGIRGVAELERRCHEDMVVAFSVCATAIGQLFDVADAGLLMPPKSTWFEPKLRSGLFIHTIER